MAETGDSRDRHVRRPLLANGERLKQTVTRPRGPSDKFHPVSIEQAWKALSPQAELLSSGIDHMQPGTKGKHVVFEATLLPNYLASSYFPAEVLDLNRLYVVGSRPTRRTKVTKTKTEENQATRTLLVAGEPQAVKGFASRVAEEPKANTKKEWEGLRRFATITLPTKESVIVRRPKGVGEAATFEAVLTHVFDALDHEEEWADYHFEHFVKWVDECGGLVDIDYRRDLRGLTFVPVFLPVSVLEPVADFNLLRAIRPMPEIAPIPESIFRMTAPEPHPSIMAEDGEVPEQVVAVFDGGVNPNLPVFSPFVQAVDLTTEPPDYHAMTHGSMVTSGLLYGHVPIVTERLPNPLVRVDHYRVFPFPQQTTGKPDHRLYEMLDKMTRTLREKDYPMVALALGPNEPIEDSAEPDRFTSELDELAHKRGIMFVAAVGNNGTCDSSLGFDRVQPPGDMVNGIGVGATTRSVRHPKNKNERAPYSARGPGREGQRVQPTVVEFGGCDGDLFVGFDAQGRRVQGCGTSFASPIAARTIGGLRGLLPIDRRRPEVLRAFSVHFAERARGHGKRYLELGYGRLPASFDPFFDCASNEVTVIYDDELRRGESVALRFPFPSMLAPATKFELTWTISYLSEIDPRAGTDYTLSGIETFFRPDIRVRSLTNPVTKVVKIVRVDLDRQEIETALAKGFSVSDEPKTHPGWMTTKGEQRLRRNGKWETLLQGRVAMQAEDLSEPRLDLQYLRRANGQLVSGDNIRPLRFAMLLTIRAKDGTPIYDQIRAQYRVLAPLVQVSVPIPSITWDRA